MHDTTYDTPIVGSLKLIKVEIVSNHFISLIIERYENNLGL
jgi:hypothetical protein